MSAFKQLRLAVQTKAQELFTLAATGRGVLVLTHADQDKLWDLYLESIPKEHNQIFRERRYYDGNYDKHFIRKLGGYGFSVTSKSELVVRVKGATKRVYKVKF